MEWDTAAGQVIVEQVRGNVLKYKSQESLKYNKQKLLNPWFVTKRNKIQQINGLMNYLKNDNKKCTKKY